MISYFSVVNSVIETKYPLSFRKDDAQALGSHLRLRHSVELIGLKRVGISDFLRFFLYRRGIVEKYIDKKQFHLFIAVDLNDLVEREIFPFWILLLKRIADAVETFKVPISLKKEIANLFLSSIQSQDLFQTQEFVREAISKITRENIMPTIFFIRFDRIVDILDNQFFSNLESLIDRSGQKLAYVFTAYRRIDEITKVELDRNFLHVFSNVFYLVPTGHKDTEVIYKTLKKRYRLNLSGRLARVLFEISGGHVQYLHLCAVILNQTNGRLAADDLVDYLSADERIKLQSEEIWESLNDSEKEIVLAIHRGKKVTGDQKRQASYLWESGLIKGSDGQSEVFSPLFDRFLKIKAGEAQEAEAGELTKKEKMLYDLLFTNLDKVCEREKIIEAVWPESEELGVSDWTIDRLAARLREKLKKQKSGFALITIKTRGFKLTQI